MNKKIKLALRTYAQFKTEREVAWLDSTLDDGCSGELTIRLEEIIERVTFDCWAFFERMQLEGDLSMLLADRIAEPEQADIERGLAGPQKATKSKEDAVEEEQKRLAGREVKRRQWQERERAWLGERRDRSNEPHYSPKRPQKPRIE